MTRKTSPVPASIVLGFLACSLVAPVAGAEEPAAPSASATAAPVSVVSSQFTDKVESSKPVGDASAITTTATYFVVVSNAGADATQITLVWKLDDKESGRQTLDVGKSPRWRTWGSFPTRKAHKVVVDVLDDHGTVLKSDALDLSAKASS